MHLSPFVGASIAATRFCRPVVVLSVVPPAVPKTSTRRPERLGAYQESLLRGLAVLGIIVALAGLGCLARVQPSSGGIGLSSQVADR